MFAKDLGRVAKYHRDPNAFISGLFVAYVMRYNPNSDFYKFLKDAELKMNLTHPYVG